MHQELQSVTKEMLVAQIFHIAYFGNNKALLRSHRYILVIKYMSI